MPKYRAVCNDPTDRTCTPAASTDDDRPLVPRTRAAPSRGRPAPGSPT